MINRCIEFHDSKLVAISTVGGVARIELNAYVHASEGRPAVDAGTGWTQRLVIEIHDAAVRAQPHDLPLWILDAELRLEGQAFENILPLPFDGPGQVLLVATGANDSRLEVSGTTIRVTYLAEPIYVEDFNPSKR